MPINPDAVGSTSDPVRHSWTSTEPKATQQAQCNDLRGPAEEIVPAIEQS
jgi:hypothetical protein